MKLAYTEKSVHTQSLIGPFLCKWGLQILTLVQTAPYWLVRMGSLWLVRENADSYAAPTGHGRSQSYWLNCNPRNSHFRVNSESRSTAGILAAQYVAFSWNAACMRGLYKQWLLDSGYDWVPLTTRSPFWQVYSSQSIYSYSKLTQIYIQSLTLLVPHSFPYVGKSSFLPTCLTSYLFIFCTVMLKRVMAFSLFVFSGISS